MTEPFAAYLRTSTEDNQSPEDSRRWQLSLATQLIRPHQGEIGAVYHDIDVSRSLPWARRPQATQLLADLANPQRGWNKLVIGEPQRAFSGPQFQLVFPLLCHHKVQLWVPEVGGPVDPDSEAHDLVMNLFGGLSKAERRRVQHRTRAAVLALAADGRWLGGRPNYGYQLVNTGLPHPNRSKAASGAQLRTLQPDPETAPVVARIFALADDGIGFKSIARLLESEGVPSPGEVGPIRHPRSVGVWAASAVRAILVNPRYLGHQVAGRLRRHDELLNASDVALGTVSRMRRQDPAQWAWSEEPSWPALVDADVFRRVNERITTRSSEQVRPRSAPGKYVLAGSIRCELCGKAMFGATAKDKPYYRCTATRPDYAVPSVEGHPPTYAVREERILAAVDTWLTELVDDAHLDATVAAILAADQPTQGEPAAVTQARRRQQKLSKELDRLLAAIRAGMDPDLAVPETKKIQAELALLAAVIENSAGSSDLPAPLTEAEVRAALTEAGGLIQLLDSAGRTERAEMYRALGLSLRYEKTAATGQERVHARLQLKRSGGRI
jgi:site-specific DNA recombinase